MNVIKARLLWLRRVPVVAACTLGLFIITAPAYADGVIDATSDGIAIEGYDPVAYFTMGKPVKGTEQLAHEWLDVTWHFASAKHRDMFAADPITYAPQHGGYCSVSVLKGGKAYADPTAWRIADGRLYLFFDELTASDYWHPKWPAVARTDENWQKTLADLLQ